tara:strand:+ start:175475 stop:175633 length:159 start_codon:yes stop_codon:yes gene_type:complete
LLKERAPAFWDVQRPADLYSFWNILIRKQVNARKAVFNFIVETPESSEAFYI